MAITSGRLYMIGHFSLVSELTFIAKKGRDTKIMSNILDLGLICVQTVLVVISKRHYKAEN